MKFIKWTIISILSLLALLVGSVFIYVKLNETEIEKSISDAYSDGFEAIVISMSGEIQSLHLDNAVVAIDKGGVVHLPVDEKERIIEGLIQARKAFHNYPKDYGYPFVNLEIEEQSETNQKIEYSVHYSARTYGYSYIVSENAIRPIYYYEHSLSGKMKSVYK